MADLEPLLPGEPRRVGSCLLAGRLHVGARGRAYLGRTATGQQVLVRLLDPAWVAANGGRTPLAMRLVRARLLDSPWVARIVEAEFGGGRPYVVAEYVEGPTLADVVRAHGPLPAEALQHLAVAAVSALAAMHEIGLAYGELTPAQVRFGPRGAQLVDLGLAVGSSSFPIARTDRVADPGQPADRVADPGQPRDRNPEPPPDRLVEQAGRRFAGVADAPAIPSSSATADDFFSWARTVSYAATGRNPQDAVETRARLAVLLAEQPELAPLLPLVFACLDPDPSRRLAGPVLVAALAADGGEPGTDPEIGTAAEVSFPAPVDGVAEVTFPAPVEGAARRDGVVHVDGVVHQGVGGGRDLGSQRAGLVDVVQGFAPVGVAFVRETITVAVEAGPGGGGPGGGGRVSWPGAQQGGSRTVVMEPPPFLRSAVPPWEMSAPPWDSNPGPSTPSGRDRTALASGQPRSWWGRRVALVAGVAAVGLVVGWLLGLGASRDDPPSADAGSSGEAPGTGSGNGAAVGGAGVGQGDAGQAGSGQAGSGQANDGRSAQGSAVGGDPGVLPAGSVGCTADYRVVEQWPGGFKGQITVTAGASRLTGWRLRWTFTREQTINQWWNVAVNSAGASVIAQNAASNGTVAAHASTTFVFLGTYRSSNPPPPVSCSPA